MGYARHLANRAWEAVEDLRKQVTSWILLYPKYILKIEVPHVLVIDGMRTWTVMQTVCTEAFCSLEVQGSDDEEEDDQGCQTSLGLSNLDSPALQVKF
jgi:hypothetical protein